MTYCIRLLSPFSPDRSYVVTNQQFRKPEYLVKPVTFNFLTCPKRGGEPGSLAQAKDSEQLTHNEPDRSATEAGPLEKELDRNYLSIQTWPIL